MVKLADVFRRGTTANLPSVLEVAIGALYFDTDLEKMFRSNGVTWEDVEVDSLSNPMTTTGDIIVGGSSGSPTRLAAGSNGQVLLLASGTPDWDTPSVNPHETGSIEDRDLLLPQDGSMYWPNDDVAIGRYDGSAWEDWAPAIPMKRWPSGTLAGLTWVNQSTSTASESIKGMLVVPATASSLRILKKAAPSTPWVLTAGFILDGHNAGGGWAGLGYRQSSDGKLIALILNCGQAWSVTKFTSPTVFSANYNAGQFLVGQRVTWLRITDDGTNRKSFVSFDRHTWLEMHSVGRTDFLTADEICFIADSGGYPHNTIWFDMEVT